MITTSNGIMISGKWENKNSRTILYRVGCDCGSKEHDLDMFIESDKELNDISLQFYKTVDYYPKGSSNKMVNFFRNISHFSSKYNLDLIFNISWFIERRIEAYIEMKSRIKDIYKILFKKEFVLEGSFIIYKEENIRDFVKAIEEAVEFCKQKNN